MGLQENHCTGELHDLREDPHHYGELAPPTVTLSHYPSHSQSFLTHEERERCKPVITRVRKYLWFGIKLHEKFSSLPPPSLSPFFLSISLSLSLSLSVETKAQAAVMADKVKHRLEQLDDLEEGSVQETLNLSQRDYVKKIDDMNHHLSSAWNRDQRVHALKVAIQVCEGVIVWECEGVILVMVW